MLMFIEKRAVFLFSFESRRRSMTRESYMIHEYTHRSKISLSTLIMAYGGTRLMNRSALSLSLSRSLARSLSLSPGTVRLRCSVRSRACCSSTAPTSGGKASGTLAPDGWGCSATDSQRTTPSSSSFSKSVQTPLTAQTPLTGRRRREFRPEFRPIPRDDGPSATASNRGSTLASTCVAGEASIGTGDAQRAVASLAPWRLAACVSSSSRTNASIDGLKLPAVRRSSS